MIKALVVDDDFAVARLHRRFLEHLDGFEVVGVLERGGAVLPFVLENDVDLVLLDVHLPDLDGLEVLSRLRAADLEVDVIMITADNERESVRRAVGQGADDYLVKPFTVQEFNARLEAYRDRVEQAEAGTDFGGWDQQEIDRLMAAATGRDLPPVGPGSWLEPGKATSADTTQLPKGFTAPTLAMISEELRTAHGAGDGTLSAREVAETCGISRVSARRYLDFLVSRKLAELRPRYGATGRPEHRYRWRV
ncbi:response regulator [Glutamicibacter sp. MNS18]|uniref:response regulator n=1 Tax=Glutamicibacter sp. MNS18 TaxID=2989817 RepID=UPI0022360EBA|nr:response regulator [Glutamicibacter sp. MNS18]MCW4465618.1 response regulator [Glutamicibacter sp. MNS18]